jgi:hypothetical protein
MPKKRDTKKSSRCPPPIRPLSGASWRAPKPQPIQVPVDWPPNYPVHLRTVTTSIMLEAAKQFFGSAEFCRSVIAKLIPRLVQNTKAPRSDLIIAAVDELLNYVLIVNERNANERYRLHKQVWQSDEWATLVRALAEKPSVVPSEAAVLPVKPARKRKQKQRRSRLPAKAALVSAPAQAQSVLAPSPESATGPAEEEVFTHSDDYRNITFRGQPHLLSANKAQIIRLLHEAHKQGHHATHQNALLNAVQSETSRVRSFFRNSPLWKTLIVLGPSKGTYRLNLARGATIPNPRPSR